MQAAERCSKSGGSHVRLAPGYPSQSARKMRLPPPAYDSYLRRQASRPPAERLQNFRAVFAPWGVSSLLVVLGGRSFGGALFWLTVPIGAMLLIAGGYVTVRFNKYASQFDQTPPEAPWTATQNGQLLIKTLVRVQLSTLSAVTLGTRMRRDLNMNDADLAQLQILLRQHCDFNPETSERVKSGDPTVEELLEGMSPSSTQGSPL